MLALVRLRSARKDCTMKKTEMAEKAKYLTQKSALRCGGELKWTSVQIKKYAVRIRHLCTFLNFIAF